MNVQPVAGGGTLFAGLFLDWKLIAKVAAVALVSLAVTVGYTHGAVPALFFFSYAAFCTGYTVHVMQTNWDGLTAEEAQDMVLEADARLKGSIAAVDQQTGQVSRTVQQLKLSEMQGKRTTAAIEAENQELKKRVSELQAALKLIESQKQALQGSQEKLRSQSQQLLAQVEKLQTLLAAVVAERKETDSEVVGLRTGANSLTKETDELEQSLATFQNALAAKLSQLAEQFVQHKEESKLVAEQREKERATAGARIAGLKITIGELEKVNRGLKESLSLQKATEDGLKTELQSVSALLKSLQEQLADVSNSKQIEEENRRLQELKLQSEQLDRLVSAKKTLVEMYEAQLAAFSSVTSESFDSK